MIPARGRIYSQLRFDDMMHDFLNMQQLAPERCRALYQAMMEFLSSAWEHVYVWVRLSHFKETGRQILTVASRRAKSLTNYADKQSSYPLES